MRVESNRETRRPREDREKGERERRQREGREREDREKGDREKTERREKERRESGDRINRTGPKIPKMSASLRHLNLFCVATSYHAVTEKRTNGLQDTTL